MNTETNTGIGQTFCGYYKTKVINCITNEVTWESDWHKNLILNQGMDALYSQNIADLTLYGVSGTGTRPNSISGQSSEITQSGTTVFLNVRTGLSDFTSSNGTYPSTVQAGDVIKYSNNSESMVTTVTDGFNLSVSTNYTFTSGQTFTIWKTSQIGLETEVNRSNDYVTGTGNCGMTTVSNQRTWRRTYDFPVEVSPHSYNELGVAWSNIGANTVFSRILVGIPIIVGTGFKLRMIYDLVGTFSPTSSIPITASIGGWPVSPSVNTYGSESLQNFLTTTIDTNGITDPLTGMLDPAFTNTGSVSVIAFVSPNSTGLAPFGSGVDRSTNAGAGGTATKASYVANSYYVDKTSVLPISVGNRTDLRTIGMGRSSGTGPAGSTNTVIAMLFDQSQSKNSSQTLSFTYRSSWSRLLA